MTTRRSKEEGSPKAFNTVSESEGSSEGELRALQETNTERLGTEKVVGICARDECSETAKEPSKYCGEDCGLAVARVRVARLRNEGIDVADFLRKRAIRLLVLRRKDE